MNPLAKKSLYFDKAMEAREKLLDSLSLYDDELTDLILSGKEISPQLIDQKIKQIVNKNPNKTCAVLIGSSLKNKGVQALLDSVLKYLPSPSEK